MPYQSLAIAMAVIGTQAVLIQSEAQFGSDPATYGPRRIMGGDPCTYAPVVVNGKNTWPGCEKKDIMGADPCTYAPTYVNGKATWPGCERKNIGGDPHTWFFSS